MDLINRNAGMTNGQFKDADPEAVVVVGEHELMPTEGDEWHIVHQLQLIKDYERAEAKK